MRAHLNPTPRGFSLLELLVAVVVSMFLVLVLTYFFGFSTSASRSASGRVSSTERLRALSTQISREVGGMLPVTRGDSGQKLKLTEHTLIFAADTFENGRPVRVDVRYEFVPGPHDQPEKGVLMRWNDRTGPLAENGTPNPDFKLGDDEWTTQHGTVLLRNVRAARFSALGLPGKEDAGLLHPRELPSSVKLDVTFGPERGETEQLETATLIFPVYRGL